MKPYTCIDCMLEFPTRVARAHHRCSRQPFLFSEAAAPPVEWPEDQPGLKAKWWRFHRANPEVYALFKRFAFDAINRGHKHYSSRTILEKMRWHTSIDTVSDDDFKINDHCTPYYARLFMADFPKHAGFFHIRETKSA